MSNKTQITYGEAAALCTECFASKAGGTIIDMVSPTTGKTLINSKTLEDCRDDYRDAERMTGDDFIAWKSSQQRTPISWNEATKKEYYEMLEVLPPAVYGSNGFLVGEAYDHDAMTGQPRYTAYRKRGDVYETASRPLTVAEYKVNQ